MSSFETLLERIDEQRAAGGFLSVGALMQLTARGNVILDPFSTLIGAGVQVGHGNYVYPNVVLEARDEGTLHISDDNLFHPQTFFLAACGHITVGSRNTFGEGGVSFKVLEKGARLTVEDAGRYIGGAHVIGTNYLGTGSQVLGPITVQNCRLESGGSYEHPDPDARGGVLKGVSVARNLNVARGEVINRRSTFRQEDVERQTAYHPK